MESIPPIIFKYCGKIDVDGGKRSIKRLKINLLTLPSDAGGNFLLRG